MKNKRFLSTIIVLVITTIILFFGYRFFQYCKDKYLIIKDTINKIEDNNNRFDYSWIDKSYTIGHAFGALGDNDEYTYSNSLESFTKYYELGQRVFEVDFDITNDGQTICNHDEAFWRKNANIDESIEYTYENFMTSKIYGQYTALDYKDIVNILHENKDIYLDTDTKHKDKESVSIQFGQIVNYAKEVDEEVLDRIIPEIYSEEMLNYVMDIYPFKAIMFSLYNKGNWQKEDVVEFCIETGVKLVSIPVNQINKELIDYFKSFNLKLTIHTVNDQDEMRKYLEDGIDIIYSDIMYNPN